jgi:hypothetical protein
LPKQDTPVVASPQLVIEVPQAPEQTLDPTLWAQPRFAEDEAEEAEVNKAGLSWLTGGGTRKDTSSRSVFIPMLLQGIASKLTRT